MNIISIGTDENILKGEGRVFDRVFEYRKLADKFVVLVFTKNESFRIIAKENLTVIPIFGKNKLAQVMTFFKFVKSVNQVLQTNTTVLSQDPFEIGLLSYLISKKYNYKLNLQLHTDISSPFFKRESVRNFLQLTLAKYLLHKADTVRVVSKHLRKYLITNLGVKAHKVFFLPIYTDISKYRFAYKNKFPKKNILMLSRIEEVKNIPLGIKAVKALRKLDGQNYHLKIVGTGQIKSKLEKEFPYNWITWENWTDDVKKEYKQADILLITSNYEGWGLTAIEAVACGTPVVMSPVGVAKEFILTGVNGYVARGHDVINITEAIHLGLTHDFEQEKMKKSLDNLQTKREYFKKFKEMLDVV
jgi:glycosyltransferase involved in cell wall biosynthesis